VKRACYPLRFECALAVQHQKHTCQVDGTQSLHGCKDLPGQVGWHGIQGLEGLLGWVVHILPPEELEHSQLLLALVYTPLPFLQHHCLCVSAVQLTRSFAGSGGTDTSS